MLKGSLPINKVSALVLGVMVLAVVLISITTVTTDVLEPNANEINAVIDSLGKETVEIGAGCDGECPDKARKQMEGLIAFNMLIGADCRLVKAVNTYSSKQPDRVAHFEGFKALKNQTDYNMLCAGARAVVLNPSKQLTARINPLQPTPSEKSNDMEGRFGKVYFDVKKEFTINQGRNSISDETLLGLRVEEDILQADRDTFPGFWRGSRNAVYLPAGLENSEDGNWDDPKDHELYRDEASGWNGLGTKKKARYESGDERKFTVGDGYMDNTNQRGNKIVKLYTYRPRMENVPIVAGDVSKFMNAKALENSPGDEAKFEKFVEEARYRFCSGVSGYIQSNAMKIDNGGEANEIISYVEDAVFPKVSITSGEAARTSCIPTQGTGSYGAFYGYRADGRSCTVEDADTGKIMSVSTASGSIDVKCGYRQRQISFPRFKGEVSYYSPAMFVKSCPAGEVTLPRKTAFSSLEGDAGFESSDVVIRAKTEDLNEKSRSSALWEFGTFSGMSSMKGRVSLGEISGAGNYEGKLNLYVDGGQNPDSELGLRFKNQLGGNINEVSLGGKTIEYSSAEDLVLDFDGSELKISYSNAGNTISDTVSVDGKLDSLKIEAVQSSLNGETEATVSRLEVTGSLRGCS